MYVLKSHEPLKFNFIFAVMRRNKEKAEDYACRHNINRWYTNANDLINDPEVNAVYVATPPGSHAEYTIGTKGKLTCSTFNFSPIFL